MSGIQWVCDECGLEQASKCPKGHNEIYFRHGQRVQNGGVTWPCRSCQDIHQAVCYCKKKDLT